MAVYHDTLEIFPSAIRDQLRRGLLSVVDETKGGKNKLFKVERRNLYFLRTAGNFYTVVAEPKKAFVVENGVECHQFTPQHLMKLGNYGLNKMTDNPYFTRAGKRYMLHRDVKVYDMGIYSDVVIHHAKNTFDNRPQYLCLLTQSQHGSLHVQEVAQGIIRVSNSLVIATGNDFRWLVRYLMSKNY